YAKAINCTFIHNTAIMYAAGGAIMNGEAINCTFIGNTASGGGAINNGTAVNCSFISNHASYGGAVYDVSAINCYFENNSAEYGGAIFNYKNDLEVYNCSFINNSATNSGGAININGNLDCNVENCEFINCSSVNDGAAINCVKANEVNIIGCSFENCNSDNGGTYLNNNDETKMNILNCIFDDIPEGVSFNYDSILTVNNVSVVKGEKAVLIANLSDIRGQLANRNISFKVNENNYFNITNDEGIATFNIDEYVTDIGYYNVTVGFEGDEHVNPISTYSNVFLNNYKGILSVSVDGKYYDDVTLIFKLIDSKTNNAVSNANIKVEFDDYESVNLRTDYNGIATYKVPFAPGNYMVTANVLDDNVDVNTVIDNFEINKIVGKVTVSQINNTILDIRLFNFNNGDVYRNINVTLKFDNMDPIYVITNEKGIATYKMDFEPGSYNVVAIVSKPYTEIQNVLETIVIADTSNSYSKVTFSSGIVFEYGSSGSIYVTVTGGSIDEENIKVLNHPEARISLVKNVITISNLNPGSYKLFVGSIPSGDLKPGNGTVGITVKKATAVIKAQKLTVALKKGTKWTITLVNAKTGKPISNMKLTLKVYTGKKYKTVHVTTNSNGVASYQTRGLSKGTHKVVVGAVDSRYNFNTLTSSIKVVKQKVLKFKVKKNIKNDGSSLSITAKYKNKGINGVKLNVLVYNGKKLVKKVSLKTKTKGKYKGVCGWGTNKLTVGSHKIVIVPANIKYGGSKKLNMKIKKSAKKYPNWETKI
ncbi:hypothetical protein, partial [Methanobrevibacter sp.]|uniref:hypothetical protein n=1 Tax=Methanobrevibacter sp. TaxID=66852 RepID=UPI003868CC04